MGLPYKLILKLNGKFRPVIHPFNLQSEGKKTYATWQFERGYETIRLFTEKYTEKEMFSGKRVLDMGCGAAGKSLYFASKGALKVTGADIVPEYEKESAELARSLGLSDKFEFVLASALSLPFPDKSFDTIIMNDFFEHVGDPEAALKEARRLCAPGGRIYINFPPYYHPLGAHLSDAVNIPWVQLFWSESAMIAAYRALVKGLPDEEKRTSLRFSAGPDGREHITYINRMTLKKFKRVLKKAGIKPAYYREVPLRPFLSLAAKLPLLKEAFVKMAVCVIEKTD